MAALSFADCIDRDRLSRIAEGLLIATAVALPWSTSAVSILMVLWLLALLPTLRWQDVRRMLLTPAGGLPVLLLLLGLAGTLWADVSLQERWRGFDSFLKLLAIPLLFVQFRTSRRAEWVFGGYVLSCVALLAYSYMLAAWPGFPQFSREFGVPVRNAASQSGLFVTCIAGLLYLVYERVTRRQSAWAGAQAAVMLAMLVNIMFVATGRTALVLFVVLVGLFAIRHLSARGIALVATVAITAGAIGWFASPYLQTRVETIWTDLQTYQPDDRNSSGERLEFAQKSIAFIKQAPLIGHGTGSIHDLFIKASGDPGATTNPHNQTFAVAIQLGLVGAAVLWAMWIAHLLLFRGPSLVEWVGLVIVVQNVVGSLFNSHLFDFLQGWIYVIGVGVAGGVALARRAEKPAPR
ncbi:MAG: O-antigen ligase family protein [Pseudolabrys sp.]